MSTSAEAGLRDGREVARFGTPMAWDADERPPLLVLHTHNPTPGDRAQVVEVRAPGMNKGNAVRTLQRELHADAMIFVGDDLGDVEAFEAVAGLAREGLPTLLVCSASREESALVELSDVLVSGPEGVLDLLRQLTDDAAALRA